MPDVDPAGLRPLRREARHEGSAALDVHRRNCCVDLCDSRSVSDSAGGFHPSHTATEIASSIHKIGVLRPWLVHRTSSSSSAQPAQSTEPAPPAAPLGPSSIRPRIAQLPSPVVGLHARVRRAGIAPAISGATYTGLDRFGATSNGFQWTPPDTQIAVGNGYVVEEATAGISIYNTSNGVALSGYPEDLKAWWCAAGHQPSSCPISTANVVDPRVIFDPKSGRFFTTTLFVDDTSHAYAVDLAVSNTSDPTGAWTTYAVQPAISQLPDQPKLAATSDKLTVTSNVYTKGGGGGTFDHEAMWIVQKSALVALSSTAKVVIFNFGGDFNIVPALSNGSQGALYGVYLTSSVFFFQ